MLVVNKSSLLKRMRKRKKNTEVIGGEGDENGDVKTRRSDLENKIEKKRNKGELRSW